MAWRSHGKNHAELIQALKSNRLIKSPRVEAAMLKVDRANYCKTLPYYDAPQVNMWATLAGGCAGKVVWNCASFSRNVSFCYNILLGEIVCAQFWIGM